MWNNKKKIFFGFALNIYIKYQMYPSNIDETITQNRSNHNFLSPLTIRTYMRCDDGIKRKIQDAEGF